VDAEDWPYLVKGEKLAKYSEMLCKWS